MFCKMEYKEWHRGNNREASDNPMFGDATYGSHQLVVMLGHEHPYTGRASQVNPNANGGVPTSDDV